MMNHQEREYERSNAPPDIVSKAREGDAKAQLELGKIFFNASLLEKNCEIAFDWISRSAQQGNMEAQFRLGDFYALGYGTLKKSSDAYQWYTKAAIQGYKKALIRIHNLYQKDIRMHCRGQINSGEEEWTDVAFKKENKIRELNEYRLEQKKTILNGAIDYYTNQFKQYQSSNQEDPIIQLNLAFLYQHGYGVKKCIRWAFEFYTLAAKQGDMDAQYNLGDLYQKHTNMKFNYRQAFKWYTESAQGGNRAAQNALAYFYLKGLATDMDYDVALFWYIKAAEAGDSEAQVILGKLYRKGDCVKQDLLMAVRWYTLAARQGNIVAQNCLAQLHQRGMLNGMGLEGDILEWVAEESMNSRLCTKLSMDISKLGDSSNFKQLNEFARRALIGDGPAMYEIGLKYLKGDMDFAQDEETGKKWIKNAASAKHKEPQSMLADLYKKGDSIEQDYHKASIWYKTLAKQNDSGAQCNIGIMYNRGLGVRQDPLEASKWFIWAADRGNSDAQYNLGMLRRQGRGLRSDYQESQKWLYKSAHQRNIQACHELGTLYCSGVYHAKKDTKKGLKLLEFAANNGSIDAQLTMGRFYRDGYFVEKDVQKSSEYFTMAADADNRLAQDELVTIYINGDGINHDYVKAHNLLRQGKDSGKNIAEYIIKTFTRRDGWIKDYSKVIDMLTEVTEKGLDDFYYDIGHAFEFGIDSLGPQQMLLASNYSKAIEFYLAASGKGDSRAYYQLGLMYYCGEGVEENLDIAIEYYKKSSIRGNADANLKLAFIYLYNFGDTQDLLKAFHYLTKASALGNVLAKEELLISKNDEEIKINMLEIATEEGYTQLQYQIGIWYCNNKNDSKAFKWLSLAADIGVTDAYYRVGTFYEEGRSVTQDYTIAAKMYHRAIERDHEDACYRLARLYQYGKGFKLDYLKAYQFYKLGADLGHIEARKVLNITLETKISFHGGTEQNFFSPSSNEYQASLLMCECAALNEDTDVQFKVGFAHEHSVSEPNYMEAYKWYSMAARKSHREALYHLGSLFEKGLGIPQDYQKANQLYQQASQLGSVDALYQLGNAYHHGNGVENDPAKAIEYYIHAAELGNPVHQCNLGRLYIEGELVPKNLMETLKWYTKAYLQGYDHIAPNLYAMYKDKPYEDFFFKKLFQNLSIASCGYFRLNHRYTKKDYFDLNNRLGIYYALGHESNNDLKKAWLYFTKEYNGSNSAFEIKDLLSLRYGLHLSEKLDILKAFEEDKELMIQIDAEHLYQWGMFFFGGVVQTQNGYNSIGDQDIYNSNLHVIIEKDYTKSFEYLKRAAKMNHAKALLQLGVMCHCGYGVDQDDEQGEKYIDEAAIEDPYLMNRISGLYHTYTGMQNFTKAFEWYKRLEKRFFEQILVDRNYTNDVLINTGLGLLYEYGDGVEQDYVKAREYYMKVADKRYNIGFHRLALLHYYGKGVPIDYEKSLNLFHETGYSSISGLPFVYDQFNSNGNGSQNNRMYRIMNDAQITGETHYYLGLQYKNGQGILHDKKVSQIHFRNALSFGCKRAQYEIEH